MALLDWSIDHLYLKFETIALENELRTTFQLWQVKVSCVAGTTDTMINGISNQIKINRICKTKYFSLNLFSQIFKLQNGKKIIENLWPLF